MARNRLALSSTRKDYQLLGSSRFASWSSGNAKLKNKGQSKTLLRNRPLADAGEPEKQLQRTRERERSGDGQRTGIVPKTNPTQTHRSARVQAPWVSTEVICSQALKTSDTFPVPVVLYFLCAYYSGCVVRSSGSLSDLRTPASVFSVRFQRN